jgi:hypothetical protein
MSIISITTVELVQGQKKKSEKTDQVTDQKNCWCLSGFDLDEPLLIL